MDRMKQAKYGVILYGGNAISSNGNHIDSHALFTLVRALNDHTRFVCMRMTGDGNPTGAENVLTWRTGYPYAVNLARGYPRYGPGEYNAGVVLKRGECDAAMSLGFDAISGLSPAGRSHLARIPSIALGPYDPNFVQGWSVVFHTATHGMHTRGTAYRMDGVPIPLRAAVTSTLPSDEEILLENGTPHP